MPEYKQAIVIRSDIGMSEGKRVAQACHASLGAYKDVDTDVQDDWERQGQTKVVLTVDSEASLRERERRADQNDLPTCLVTDAGRTELEPGTTTCLGIGPGETDRIDAVTGDLATV